MTTSTTNTYRELALTTFQMSLAAKIAHWNIMGSDFPQLHAFFGALYEELDGATDTLAEDVRTTGALMPGEGAAYIDTRLSGSTHAKELLTLLNTHNDQMLKRLEAAYPLVDAENKGLGNRIQDRLLAHQKHGWMLRATLDGRK